MWRSCTENVVIDKSLEQNVFFDSWQVQANFCLSSWTTTFFHPCNKKISNHIFTNITSKPITIFHFFAPKYCEKNELLPEEIFHENPRIIRVWLIIFQTEFLSSNMGTHHSLLQRSCIETSQEFNHFSMLQCSLYFKVSVFCSVHWLPTMQMTVWTALGTTMVTQHAMFHVWIDNKPVPGPDVLVLFIIPTRLFWNIHWFPVLSKHALFV